MYLFRRDPLSLALSTILGLCLLSLLYMQLLPPATAQILCSGLPETELGVYHNWPQDAIVRVNIDSTYTDSDQRSAISSAFIKWMTAGSVPGGNCSGVAFHSFSNDPVSAAILQGAVPPKNTVNVVKRTDGGVTGGIRIVVGASGRVDSLVIYIPSCKTNLTSFTSTTAHEIRTLIWFEELRDLQS